MTEDEIKKLPDAGHIYTGPRYWPHKEPWKPREGGCCAAVSGGGHWPRFHQCNNKAKATMLVNHHGKAVELGYCGIHDPIKVAEKEAKREAEYRAKRAAYDRKLEVKRAQREAIGILRQIAKGHNDPRQLALEHLNKYDLLEESE